MFDNFTYILFDLDNTVLDFSQISTKALQNTLVTFNIEPHSKNIELYHHINGLFWHYFEQHKITADELRVGRFERFLEAINEDRNAENVSETYINNLIEQSEWIEGAQALLTKLSLNKELILITNGLKSAQRGRIHKHKLEHYFTHIFISEEMGVSKPHNEFFQKVHQKIGSPIKDSVLVVGDNPISDIKGGKEFGYKTCWFNYSGHKKTPKHADYRINSWEDYA